MDGPGLVKIPINKQVCLKVVNRGHSKSHPKNHVFKFTDRMLFVQEKGEAIGVSLAGEVPGLFMTWWDKKLKERLEENNIKTELYSRYVDDINFIVRATLPSRQYGQEKETMESIQK